MIAVYGLMPEEAAQLRKAERCGGCRHLETFHYYLPLGKDEALRRCGIESCMCQDGELQAVRKIESRT